MKRLRLGVPQIIGALVALAVLAVLGALRLHLGGAAIAINWPAFLAFVGFSALLALVAALRGRRPGP